MKQNLNFLDEGDFQNFVSQLFGEELPSFQAIEGSGGDGGLDGLEGEIAYQVYFPEVKNRTKAKYIDKIDKDLVKLQKTIAKLEIIVKKWIFVVPEDLRYEVVGHLQKKSQEYGIECIHWGMTKLSSLVNKHPSVKNSFPGIFLPDLKDDIERVSAGINEISRVVSSDLEILRDDDFELQLNQLKSAMENEEQSLYRRFSGTSLPQAAAPAIRAKYLPQIEALQNRKTISDRSFELECKSINIQFDELAESVNSDYSARGMFHSGMRVADLNKVREKRNLELEKAALRYGKTIEGTEPEGITSIPTPSFDGLHLKALRVFAEMDNPKEIVVIGTLGGMLLTTIGMITKDSTTLKEFLEEDPSEMQAVLEELQQQDILTSRSNKSGKPIYRLTSTGYRIVKEDPEIKEYYTQPT